MTDTYVENWHFCRWDHYVLSLGRKASTTRERGHHRAV